MTGEDHTLVRAVAAGSEDALVKLYDRYAGAVYATARRLTTDRGLAEDVVQETFLALWNRAEQYNPAMGSLPAWLLTIARNRTIDRLRALGRRPPTVPVSDVERTVLVLAYRDELSQSEIAERLGWPIGTVKTRTRRALLRMRNALGPGFMPVDGSGAPVGAVDG
jgi:RNA polymerase sigma-70 factor (ECF subfamily)